jgi:uncharacterized membrane protein YjgN (DUF898 family)
MTIGNDAPPELTRITQSFEFTGSGSEYFRIWAVNLLLNFLTAGLYSPWAKVRREQYFARNTRLGAHGFDYHGDPFAILKGRLLLFVLLAAGGLGIPAIHAGMILIGIVLLPWVVQRSIRFRLRNTSYRNVRFGFDGPVKLFYAFALKAIACLAVLGLVVALVMPNNENDRLGYLLTLAITAIAAPFIYLLSLSALRLYVVNFSRWGDAKFSADFGSRTGWKLLAAQLIPLLVGALLIIVGMVFLSPFLFVLIPIGLVMGRAYLQARVLNIAWNDTRINSHPFYSSLSELGFAWANLRWTVLTVITFGLYRPWAAVNLAKMRAESLALSSPEDLLNVLANPQDADSSAFAQEAGDWFDIDISL